MSKKKKAKNNYKVIAGFVCLIAVVAVVGVIGIGKAQMQKSGVTELTELANSLGGNVEAFQAGIAYLTGNGVTEEMTLGSSGDYLLSTFTAKAIRTSGITIDGPSYFTSAITATATTTLPVNVAFPIIDSLDLTGTSSAKGATQNVIAYYTHSGSDILVNWSGIDVTAALGSFEASMQAGTSTWVGGVEGGSLVTTSSASIIATTTISSAYLYQNGGTILDSHGTPGDGLADNDYVFIMTDGDVLFATWTPYGATSSASFTVGGQFTGEGNMLGTSNSRGN